MILSAERAGEEEGMGEEAGEGLATADPAATAAATGAAMPRGSTRRSKRVRHKEAASQELPKRKRRYNNSFIS